MAESCSHDTHQHRCHGATMAVTSGHVGPTVAALAGALATKRSHIIPDLKSKV